MRFLSKKIGIIVFVLIIFSLFLNFVFADVIRINGPNGRYVSKDASSACGAVSGVVFVSKYSGWNDGGKYCSAEGSYSSVFECGGLSKSVPCYTVNWDAQAYCKADCYSSSWTTQSPEWNIGGSTNECCGDDPGEFPRQCQDYYNTNSNPSCGSDLKSCCNNQNDCINDQGNCVGSNQCALLSSKKAYCDLGKWEDPDKTQDYCSACGSQWVNYEGADATAGKTCCGDDISEQWCAGTDEACHNANYYTNPDDNEYLCESCDNSNPERDWLVAAEGNGCCGDDMGDCGDSSQENYLCSNESNSYKWMSSSVKQGDIHYVFCNKKEYLADGTIWYKCDGLFWEKEANISSGGDIKHHYICIGAGKGSVAECRGDGDQYSDSNDGLIKATGGNVSYENSIYYCADDSDWTTDLDVKNKKSCQSAGYKWTGTYCCSEDDDANEYYNDLTGACWDKTEVRNTNLVPGYSELAVEEGVFHGCAINKALAISNNDETDPLRTQDKPYKINTDLLELDNCPNPGVYDCPNNNALITDHTYCDIISSDDNEKFCSYKEEWINTNGKKRSHLSYINWTDPEAQEAECCEQSQCWNGSDCINSQETSPSILTYPGTNLRCMDGEWKESFLRYTWDKKIDGYCPEKTQCLVNPNGDYNNNNNPSKYNYGYLENPLADNDNPQCIDDGQYIGNRYCENGIWTTRTKMVALQLLSLTENSYDPKDYSLFCDSYENALNYYKYTISVWPSVNYIYEYFIKQAGGCKIYPESALGGVVVPCVNKVCVLKYKKNSDGYDVVFGAPLNQPIDSTDYSFLEAINKPKSYCVDSQIYKDNNFHSCDGSDDSFDTWYHPELQLIVYAKNNVKLTNVVFWDKFVLFIKNPFKSIFNTIIDVIMPGYPSGADIDYDFINRTSDFDKIYLNNKNQKAIRGVTEKVGDEEFFAVTYEGFSADVCESVRVYMQNNGLDTDVINCDEKDLTYYVETRYEPRLNIWYDLTSTLRVE